MSKFISWSMLFVLAVLVSLFSGCGGGSSSTSNDTAYSWDTDRNIAQTPNQNTGQQNTTPAPNSTPSPSPSYPYTEPTTPVPTPNQYTVPEDTTQNTEPNSDTPSTNQYPPTEPTTPTPTPTTPDTNNTYTDTYDIASVLNGSWYGVSGSGTATGRSGQINLIMSRMSISIVNTQVNGSNGMLYVTYRQYWDYEYQNYDFQALLYLDAEEVTMRHTGSNTWSLENTDGFATVMLTSATTAIVTQQGIVETDDGQYNYSVRYTIRKL